MRFRLLAFAFCLGTGAFAADDAASRHVILITLDGFPASLLRRPNAPLPHIRRLAEEGVAAEAMIVSNPSTTWTNHTTLVTGVPPARHSVLFNGILRRGPAGEPRNIEAALSKAELVAVPTLYDLAHEAGMRTAGIHWPCTREAATLDDNWPDVPNNLKYITPRLREELVRLNVLGEDEVEGRPTVSGAARDLMRAIATAEIISKRRPHLLLLHFVNTDGIQHQYGPDSPATFTAFGWADSLVGRVVAAVEQAGLRERTTFFITTDHGFMTVKRVLRPNVLLRQAGWLETSSLGQITRARAQARGGATAFIYFSDPAPASDEIDKVATIFRGRPEIEDVLTPERFAEFGYPAPETNRGMGHLVLVGKPGVTFAPDARGDEFAGDAPATGNRGTHGAIASASSMHGVFVASGFGIQRGVPLGTITNLEVAPTIAALLGLELPAPAGPPLQGILTDRALPPARTRR